MSVRTIEAYLRHPEVSIDNKARIAAQFALKAIPESIQVKAIAAVDVADRAALLASLAASLPSAPPVQYLADDVETNMDISTHISTNMDITAAPSLDTHTPPHVPAVQPEAAPPPEPACPPAQ